MKFTKPLLFTSLLITLATSPMAFASDDAAGSGTGEGAVSTAGESPGDTQIITVNVPEVSLIDVSHTTTPLVATLVAPTDAGDNFAEITIPGSPTYDISANVLKGTTNKRKIAITAGTIPADWKFTFNVGAPTGATSVTDATFISTTTAAVDVVTGIGNIAEKNIAIAVELGPEVAGRMPSYTTVGENVVFTYTITADL